MLLWVIILFLITLLFSVYRGLEGFTAMKDEFSVPLELTTMRVNDVQALIDGGLLWKEVEPTRLQELLIFLDSNQLKAVLENNTDTIDNKMGDAVTREIWKNLVDLFRVKIFEEYTLITELSNEISQISATFYVATNPTMREKYQYYVKFEPSRFPAALQENLAKLKQRILTSFLSLFDIYTRFVLFYQSGFKKENNQVSLKRPNLHFITSDISARPENLYKYFYDNTNFLIDNKNMILRVLQKKLAQQRDQASKNMLDFSTKSTSVQDANTNVGFFSNIMDKLNVLEKKELVPVFTNKVVDQIAVDRYMDPACPEGDSLFCSGKITCADIYGNEIAGLMTSQNTSYTGGKTYANCGSYMDRVEYKDWIASLSNNLLGSATEIITYDTNNCTIKKPWKLSGTNTSCYLSVEKAQDAFLQTNQVKNELLVGSVILLEASFLEDYFSSNPESIFNLNHPTENIQVQRLRFKGNITDNNNYDKSNRILETNQDIDMLKQLPKVSVNKTIYYKGKITQITKQGYDLIIPDEYGIKVAGIKKENLFMPNVSYLNILNETLTDATVNSLPRPMCSGSFSKCTNKPKILFDPSDTMKKNMINLYEKSSPYLLTSTEMSDNCPSSSYSGFSVF